MLLIFGCGSSEIINSCEYDVGDNVEITLYESGSFDTFNVNIEGCDNAVVIKTLKSQQVSAGDVAILTITSKKSSHSYTAQFAFKYKGE